MQKPFTTWFRFSLAAILACLVWEPAVVAQESPLNLQGSQEGCGWISDGCCADDCCYPQTTVRLEYLMWWGRGQTAKYHFQWRLRLGHLWKF